ncbi:MAG: glycine cleavage system protein GcvH [Chloroflexota bacterium]
MNPTEYKYTKDHEWLCPEPGGNARIGITDYAQSQLGDVVYLDLPAPGKQIEQSRKMGEIESVKAVSDLFAPASGKVIEINQNVINDPSLVNKDPYGEGWLVRIRLTKPAELDALMTCDDYDRLLGQGEK